MKIVADTNIPFLKGVLEPYAEVVYMDGRAIDREAMRDADAIIIRTRTKCNEETLAGSRVEMIASATIGTDHIDLEWCRNHGIEVKNAEGCNAGGVMDYVFSALYGTASRRSIKLEEATIGIIGVGTVGKLVEKMAEEFKCTGNCKRCGAASAFRRARPSPGRARASPRRRFPRW